MIPTNSKLASFLQATLFGTVFTDLSTSIDRSSWEHPKCQTSTTTPILSCRRIHRQYWTSHWTESALTSTNHNRLKNSSRSQNIPARLNLIPNPTQLKPSGTIDMWRFSLCPRHYCNLISQSPPWLIEDWSSTLDAVRLKWALCKLVLPPSWIVFHAVNASLNLVRVTFLGRAISRHTTFPSTLLRHCLNVNVLTPRVTLKWHTKLNWHLDSDFLQNTFRKRHDHVICRHT